MAANVRTERATPGRTIRGLFLPASWGTLTQRVFAAEFEQQTGIRVEIDLVGREAIHDRMGTLFAAQDASYDLFNIDYNWLPEFAEGGHLIDLEQLLTDGDFLPSALAVAAYKGVCYGLPQTVHPHLLWYRRDLFAAAGLPPPATMDAWLAATRHFHGRAIDGQRVYGWAAQAVQGYGNVHTWLSFLYSFGADAFTDISSLEPALNTPAALAATEMWAEMMRYTPPGINDYNYNDVVAAASGIVVTCLHGSWGAFVVDEPSLSRTVGQWDFVKVPRAEASVPHLTEWLLAVSRYSRHPDEAIAFIRYLQSPENDVRQTLLGAGDPVRAGSYADLRLQHVAVEGHPDLRRFRRHTQVLEAMQTAKPRPIFAQEEQWRIGSCSPSPTMGRASRRIAGPGSACTRCASGPRSLAARSAWKRPRVAEPPSALHCHLRGETMAETISILIADDHPMFRFGMRARLSAEADLAVVGEAGSGDEALTLVGQLTPKTVRNYVSTVFGKLQVADRAEAIIKARDAGLGG